MKNRGGPKKTDSAISGWTAPKSQACPEPAPFRNPGIGWSSRENRAGTDIHGVSGQIQSPVHHFQLAVPAKGAPGAPDILVDNDFHTVSIRLPARPCAIRKRRHKHRIPGVS
jgi:hypothetical protein